MKRSVSCTCTVGTSSEQHNHDLEYRSTLKHVHNSPDGVIELIPYRNYYEQINALMRPHIEEYNRHQEERYQAAWQRYNEGKIKTKPRKRDYQPMGYDYCADHVNDTHYNQATKKVETVKMWRGLIFGLGDKNDRKNGIITQQEAVTVMTRVVERWLELFPNFKLLGATIHLDEEGFYHCHIDYVPFVPGIKAKKQEQGLRISLSQETALEHMGYQPEQSIINESDKAPIRFNAFRNRVYLETEKALNAHGLRLLYGASKIKEPQKDSSVNQRMENWQNTQDGVRTLQELKNHTLDIVEKDSVTPEEIKEALTAAHEMEYLLDTVSQQKRSRTNKDNITVHFSLFDQIKSIIRNMVTAVAVLVKRIEELMDKYFDMQDRADALEETVEQQSATIERYKEENHRLQYKVDKHYAASVENEHRKQFMAQLKMGDIPLENKFKLWLQREKGR